MLTINVDADVVVLHDFMYACNSRGRSRSRGIAEALLDVEEFTVAALGVLANGSVSTCVSYRWPWVG